MQSVADKEALLSKMSSLLEISTEAKRQVSEQAEMHKESASRLRMKLTASSSEITKGNQIIAKLQSDGQALRGKLKLKQAVVQQLQEQGSQKDASLHSADKGDPNPNPNSNPHPHPNPTPNPIPNPNQPRRSSGRASPSSPTRRSERTRGARTRRRSWRRRRSCSSPTSRLSSG